MPISWKTKYENSPRWRATRAICEDIRRALGDDWATAFDACQVTRGRNIGLPKASAPADSRANVIWQAWRDAVQEFNAGQFNCFPNRSYAGSIGAIMWCKDERAREAYQVTLASVTEQLIAAKRAKDGATS